MAISFAAKDPAALLRKFKKAIDDKHVTTWSYDKDGDFTHNVDQWRYKAWLRPRIGNGELVFNVLKPKTASVTWEVYGVYQGRFAESMTVHCHDDFTQAIASAKPAANDNV